MGIRTAATSRGVCCTWVRWEEFVATYKERWAGLDFHEAAFTPVVGLLADYVALRSLRGKTDARGAIAGLKRLNKALRLAFPVEDNSVSG